VVYIIPWKPDGECIEKTGKFAKDERWPEAKKASEANGPIVESFSMIPGRLSLERYTQEVFGPVLSIQFYDSDDEAIDVANTTKYGLAGFVQAGTVEEAREIAKHIRAGRIYINGGAVDRTVPFGGYKHSGNGREYRVFGIEEYLEVKAVLGARAT
jgi:delta 1-pyrroline-5-carboxylate dehydrogenase